MATKGLVAAWRLVAVLAVADTALALQRRDPPGEPGVARTSAYVPIDVRVTEQQVYVTPPGTGYSVMTRNRSGKVVVVYGLRLFRRERDARLRAVRSYVVRPRMEFRPDRQEFLSLPLEGGPPEYALNPTFALYEDGTWAGDGTLARREVASLREEYAAARHVGQLLAGLTTAPTREDLTRVVDDLSRQLARATGRAARQQFEWALQTFGRVLDERTRGDRTYEEAVYVVRDKVDRTLGRLDRLSFVARSEVRG